jgi:uncharacterized protein YgiM (DUF1202 family)
MEKDTTMALEIAQMAGTLDARIGRRDLVKKMGAGALVAAAAGIGLAGRAKADFTGFYLTTTALNMRARASKTARIIMVVPARAGVKHVAYGANGYVKVDYLGTVGFVIAGGLVDTNGGSTDPGPGPVLNGQAYTLDAVNFRSGPSSTASVFRVLAKGTLVQTSTTYSNGYRYVSHQGQAGWIHADYLGDNNGPDGPVPATQVTTAALNLRAEPSTSAQVLLVIPQGATVRPNGMLSNGFAQVTYNGTLGWASTQYLR